MDKDKLIEFYRMLANGVPLSNLMWGKGKGYLQAVAKSTLELINKNKAIQNGEFDKPEEKEKV